MLIFIRTCLFFKHTVKAFTVKTSSFLQVKQYVYSYTDHKYKSAFPMDFNKTINLKLVDSCTCTPPFFEKWVDFRHIPSIRKVDIMDWGVHQVDQKAFLFNPCKSLRPSLTANENNYRRPGWFYTNSLNLASDSYQCYV